MRNNNGGVVILLVGALLCLIALNPSGGALSGNSLNWNLRSAEVPGMDLPVEMRMHNYAGGSCVHASTESHMRWNGQEAWADWCGAHYSGGEDSDGLRAKLDAAGLTYAFTDSGDVSILDAASRTRRGAVIFYYPKHSINFVGWEPTTGDALLLDNNRVNSFIHVKHDEFISAWHGYGGFALTLVYFPTPPLLQP